MEYINKMEYQKIKNLLHRTTNKPSKFETKTTDSK